MQIGIGLPNALPGVAGRDVVAWARAAEDAGYHSVASIDRVAFVNYDPVVALAAAAAVTQRVQVLSAIMLAPLRTTGLLAKAASSLDRLSEGRFLLGVGVGSREDDYLAAGAGEVFHRRGGQLDHQLEQLGRIWRGEEWEIGAPLGPEPFTAGGPPVLVGGSTPSTWARVAHFGSGWISGRPGHDAFTKDVADLHQAWRKAGRTDEPRLLALTYFSLGPYGAATAEGFIRRYYGYAPFVESMLASTSVSAEEVQATAANFASAGCDELLLVPCSSNLDQVGLLSDALSSTGFLAT